MLNYENALICKEMFSKKAIAETSNKIQNGPFLFD